MTGDNKVGLQEAIYALQVVSGVKGNTVPACSTAYSSEIGRLLAHIHSDAATFDLFPGNYILQVNGTAKSVAVQPGRNDFPVGNIYLSMSRGYYDCGVYNSTATAKLSDIHTDKDVFDLFPGNYTLQINGTTREVTVQPGKNDLPVGNIYLSMYRGYYDCGVYNATGTKKFSNIHTDKEVFDLFPGNYILSINGSTKAVEIRSGRNEFPAGIVKLSWLTGYYDCEVYDSTGIKLSTVHTDEPFELFPGTYTLSVNGSNQKTFDIRSGDNIINQF